MKFHDQLILASHNLMLHKVRSILTSLGIIFGVASVIAMLAISEGAKIQALASFEAMGIDKIIVASQKPPVEGKDTSQTSNSSVTSYYGLTQLDLENIRNMENVKKVSTIRNSREKIVKGITRLDLTLAGVDQDYLEMTKSNIIPSQGRWFTSTDFLNKRQVCVIGRTAKQKLFHLGSDQRIVGNTLHVAGRVFKIIGIMENDHGTNLIGSGSPNDMIAIPMPTSDSLFGKEYRVMEPGKISIEHIEFDTFIVSIHNTAYIDYTSRRIASYLDKTHGESRDWEKIVPYDLLLQKEQTQNIFTIVMASIAGISLLVGGIGIMNIMLANVYERRKEIGTRRALGAKKTDIILQFLLETIFLTFVGGGIGVAVGAGIAMAVAHSAGWPVSFSLWFILLAILISAIIGIIFGTYPAWKAAQQNPIDVLRAE